MLNLGLGCSSLLREYYTPIQQLSCFVLYLKIINAFLKNNICILFIYFYLFITFSNSQAKPNIELAIN